MNNNQNERSYLIYNDSELIKKRKRNNVLLFVEYGLFSIIVLIVICVFMIDKNNVNKNGLVLDKENNYQEEVLVIDDNIESEENNIDNNILENQDEEVKENTINNSESKKVVTKSDNQVKKSIPNQGIVVYENPVKAEEIKEEKKVEIESIKLDSNISLKKGNYVYLIPIIMPSNAIDKSLTWSRNNDNVILDQNGKVYGNNIGESIVTVTSNNGISATCVIKIETNKIEVSKIELNANQKDVILGNKEQLVVTLSPNNATERNITFSSSNPKIVSVDNKGYITANSVGTATITAKSSNGKTAKCVINVKPIEATSVKLNAIGIDMEINKTYELKATITPNNSTNKKVTYSSSNSKIATVDSNGKIKAISVGTATITAKSSNGKTAKCVVNVKPIEVTSVVLNTNNISLKENATYELKVTITPNNSTNKKVTYSSSNSKIATVDSNGKIKAISVGTATITVKSSNGKIANCNVMVNGSIYKLTLNNQDATSTGTQNIWFKSNSESGYYTDANLKNCLNQGTIVKPTKEGYTFNGYYTEPNGKGNKYINENGLIINNASKTLKSNTILYAYWIINNYTISFNVNGGSSWTNTTCPSDYVLSNGLCSKKMSYNSTYQSFPVPTKEGYTFAGWYTLATGGEKVTSLTVKTNTTLYAHWVETKPTINFVYFNQMNYSRTKFCGQNKTIANAGCGVTSAAMVATSLTGNNKYTPVYMMNMAYKAKFCGGSKSGTDPSFFKYFAKTLGLKFKQVSKSNQSKVINYLKSGNSLVIAHMGKGTFTNNGHFIVLSKVDDKGNVYVNDPADKKKNGYYSISKIAKELKYDKSFYIISK